jgi:hypothetical protein
MADVPVPFQPDGADYGIRKRLKKRSEKDSKIKLGVAILMVSTRNG